MFLSEGLLESERVECEIGRGTLDVKREGGRQESQEETEVAGRTKRRKEKTMGRRVLIVR